MAFFPGEEITTKPEAEANRQLEVVYGEDTIRLSFCGEEGAQTLRTEVSVCGEVCPTETADDLAPSEISDSDLRKLTKSALKRGVYRLLS